MIYNYRGISIILLIYRLTLNVNAIKMLSQCAHSTDEKKLNIMTSTFVIYIYIL